MRRGRKGRSKLERVEVFRRSCGEGDANADRRLGIGRKWGLSSGD